MRESQFQSTVIKYLRSKGCYVLNVAGGTQIPKGTPDLIVCFPNGEFGGIELKTDIGRTTELQEHHIREIRKSGGYARVLRPSELESFKMEIEDMTHV